MNDTYEVSPPLLLLPEFGDGTPFSHEKEFIIERKLEAIAQRLLLLYRDFRMSFYFLCPPPFCGICLKASGCPSIVTFPSD